uniref:Endoplasmic reticulum junction formation protein lunapark n=1 Tax=Glossina palpalis gambiensis TaxID=67801 RepID=A0A1B0BNG4_9MUSC
MGALLAKFRKNQDTTQLLESLHEQIESLEKYTFNTQEQKKRFVGNFLAVSIGVYVVAFAIFYFAYFPSTWSDRLLYSLPLFIFPVVIVMLRYLLTWYFQRKLNKNSTKLSALRAEKKKILEQVMDKETYKVAVNLLLRFGDKSSSTTRLPFASPLNRTLNVVSPQSKIMQGTLVPTPATPNASLSARAVLTGASNAALTSDLSMISPTLSSSLFSSQALDQQLRRRTPFPIVNSNNKSIFERLVDVLIGDGPQDRFAMICKQCHGHNGMALKEEFEYMTFRCIYCNGLNPARKSRPIAPRLSVLPPTLTQEPHESTSSDSSSSDGLENGDFNESIQEEKKFTTMDSDNNNDSNSEMNVSLSSSRTNELENRMRDIQIREELDQQLRLRTRSERHERNETLASESSAKVEKREASD